MRRTVTEVLDAPEGEEVELLGWIWNKREHGKLVFVDLRDGTGVVQVAAKAGTTDQQSLELLRELGRESVVKVRGLVVRDPR
ncbi:MAG: OB-fold nucleic acid binding domain-containing protein, partial [Nitrososphaerota archaeon]